MKISCNVKRWDEYIVIVNIGLARPSKTIHNSKTGIQVYVSCHL